jgi:hypothetical protein
MKLPLAMTTLHEVCDRGPGSRAGRWSVRNGQPGDGMGMLKGGAGSWVGVRAGGHRGVTGQV